jgi:nucleoside-diphosphate-sugar epimerase
VSTTGVLGEPGDWAADEEAPCAPTNAYEDSKWKAEQLVREAIQQGLPAVIVRPGLVFGPGDLHLLGFYRSIQRGLFRPIGNHAVWLSVIYVDDMADALACCGQHPMAVGECFNIAHPKPVTIATLAQTISAALGKTFPSGIIPLPVAQAVATIGDLLPPKLKPLAPLTHSRLDFLTHSRYYDVSKSQRLLGYVAPTELTVGVERTVAWYREQGYLGGNPI